MQLSSTRKTNLFSMLHLNSLRRSVWYQPIALLLAFCMAGLQPSGYAQETHPGAAPLRPQRRFAPAERGFAEATAQPRTAAAALPTLPANCGWVGGNHIIQRVCVTSKTLPLNQMVTAIESFETEGIESYLGMIGASNTAADAAFILNYARSDMRNILRAYLFNLLLGMCYPDADLSANNQEVVTWFKEVVRTYETASANAAFADFSKWLATPCAWRPDPDIAKLYKIKYVPCAGTIAFNTAPNDQYYRMVGRKLTYDTDLAALPKLPSVTLPSVVTPQAVSHATVQSEASRASSGSTTSGTRSGATIFDSMSNPMVALGGVVGVAAVAGFTTLAVLFIKPIRKYFLPFRNRKSGGQKTTKKPEAKEVEKELDEKIDEVTEEPEQAIDTGDISLPAGEEGGSAAADLEAIQTEAEIEAAVEGAVDAEADAEGILGFLAPILAEEAEVDAVIDAAVGPETAGVGAIVGLVVLAVTVVVTVAVVSSTAKGRVAKELQDDVQHWLDPRTEVDIQTMLLDSHAKVRLMELWVILTYPDIHSMLPLPVPSSSDPGLLDTPISGNTAGATVPATFGYTNWQGVVFQPKAYGNAYFIQTGTQDLGARGAVTYDSITTTLDYTGWDNNRYMATRSGHNFIITKRTPTDTDKFCAQSAPGGTSHYTDASTCYSYASPSIQIKDSTGQKHLLSAGILPSLNGDANPVFYTTDVNRQSSPITAGGNPVTDISLVGGDFPGGISIAATGGATSGQFFLRCCGPGIPIVTTTGHFTLKATNIYGSVTRDYSVTVVAPGSGAVGIVETSAPPAGSKLGTFVRWSYKATGSGPFHFYTNMNWGTMQLIDHGDGSADFEGYPYDAGGQPFLCPGSSNGGCNIWVTNTTQSYTTDSNHAHSSTSFTSLLSHGPDAVFAGPSSATFISGIGRKVTVTATGGSGQLPVQWLFPCIIPANLRVRDNGDGSASIWSTAPGNFSGQYRIKLYPYSPGGTLPGALGCLSSNFTANLVANTVLLSGNAPEFTVGHSDSFTLKTNNPASTFVVDSDLPSGLSLSASVNGTATIQGTPAVGTGGLYHIRYHAESAGVPVLTPQPLLMMVNEAPALTLPPTVYVMAGVRSSYAVIPTAGFDHLNGAAYKINGHRSGALGPNVDTPSGMSFSAITPIMPAGNGAPSFEGTPDPSTAGSTRAVTVTLTNSYGSATASTVLKVVAAGDANHDGVVDCGDYSFVKSANGQNASMQGYVAAADINQDGYINALDLAFVSAHLQKGTVCR